MRVFRSARKADPTVPKQPVVKLKTVLLRKGRKKAAKKTPAKGAPVTVVKPVG